MGDPTNGGIRIEPDAAPRAPRAVYATVILENTSDARVTQAGCLTTPAERPTAYCYFEVTATIPEPAFAIALSVAIVGLATLARSRLRSQMRTGGIHGRHADEVLPRPSEQVR